MQLEKRLFNPRFFDYDFQLGQTVEKPEIFNPLASRIHEWEMLGHFLRGMQSETRIEKAGFRLETKNGNLKATSYAVGFAVSWKWCYRYVWTSLCPKNVRK